MRKLNFLDFSRKHISFDNQKSHRTYRMFFFYVEVNHKKTPKTFYYNELKSTLKNSVCITIQRCLFPKIFRKVDFFSNDFGFLPKNIKSHKN